ncbi:MAG: ArsR family transcriptional regulator [Methanoregula sp.]
MKTCIIYNSYSGVTRRIAEQIQKACDGDLVEVKSKEYSSKLTAYTIGCYRAMKGMCDRIEPEIIEVSLYDRIVIGTPVWAGRATPAINAAVEALAGCNGKKAIIYATCDGKEGETIPFLRKALEAKGVTVTGEFVFDKTGAKDPERISAMIAKVKAMESTR